MPAMFLTAAESADLGGLWSVVLSFMTGFLGAIVDLIELVVADKWLALLIVAVPLSMLVFAWARGLLKFKRR